MAMSINNLRIFINVADSGSITRAAQALFISLLVSWTLGALISWLIFRRGGWRKKAMSQVLR